MKQTDRNAMRNGIVGRIKVFYLLLIVLVGALFLRIIWIQFSPPTARMSETIHRRMLSVDSLDAHRGTIYARDGRPLAA